jgi:hypothetical protein
MKHGPVLSNLYNLIKGRSQDKQAQMYWDSRFSTDGDDLLANFDQYPEGKLSKAEKAIIDKIDGQFHQNRYGELIDYVHVNCPEWRDPGATAIPLSLADILSALGRTQDEIDWILEETEAFKEEDRIFAALAAEE